MLHLIPTTFVRPVIVFAMDFFVWLVNEMKHHPPEVVCTQAENLWKAEELLVTLEPLEDSFASARDVMEYIAGVGVSSAECPDCGQYH